MWAQVNVTHSATSLGGAWQGLPAPALPSPQLPGRPGPEGGTHNSLMRMSGTQMLSVGMDSLVMLSKSSGFHWRNSSVQY